MSETSLRIEDVERLAAILDAVELGERNRATLRAVFALAGQAAGAAGDEVGGFSFETLSWGGGVGDALSWNGGAGDDRPPENVGPGGGLFQTFCANGQHIGKLS